jgi:hypothetical protein
MQTPEQELPSGAERVLVRWVPSALLDLPPSEPALALRTPHRVMLQALPSSRAALGALLARGPFEITLELENAQAPLLHVPVHEVHEARLAMDLPLDWATYYWLVDGLQADLAGAADPPAGLLRGRLRLAVVEGLRRDGRGFDACDLDVLDGAWTRPPAPPLPDVERHGEPPQALQQYVRGLTAHLVEHAGTRSFVDQLRELLLLAERRRDTAPLAPSAEGGRMLSLYMQHRAFGASFLTAPAGMIAGWHLLFSAYVLAVWWAGLLLASRREPNGREALLAALHLLDQGLWRDEPLVHDVLRHLNAGEYASPELAAALAMALGGATART